MEARNKHRVANEGYDDLSKYFNSMKEYEDSLSEKGLIDAL